MGSQGMCASACGKNPGKNPARCQEPACMPDNNAIMGIVFLLTPGCVSCTGLPHFLASVLHLLGTLARLVARSGLENYL
jgi:hypothetical protein